MWCRFSTHEGKHSISNYGRFNIDVEFYSKLNWQIQWIFIVMFIIQISHIFECKFAEGTLDLTNRHSFAQLLNYAKKYQWLWCSNAFMRSLQNGPEIWSNQYRWLWIYMGCSRRHSTFAHILFNNLIVPPQLWYFLDHPFPGSFLDFGFSILQRSQIHVYAWPNQYFLLFFFGKSYRIYY